MPVTLEDLPSRVRTIVVQEVAAGRIWQRAPITVDAVLGRSRKRCVVRVRQAIWWRCREELIADGKPVSLPWIGSLFAVDHTTVQHGCRRHPTFLVGWAEAKQQHYVRSMPAKRAA